MTSKPPEPNIDGMAMEYALMQLHPDHSRELAYELFNEMCSRFGTKPTQEAMTRALNILKMMGT